MLQILSLLRGSVCNSVEGASTAGVVDTHEKLPPTGTVVDRTWAVFELAECIGGDSVLELPWREGRLLPTPEASTFTAAFAASNSVAVENAVCLLRRAARNFNRTCTGVKAYLTKGLRALRMPTTPCLANAPKPSGLLLLSPPETVILPNMEAIR